MTKRQAKKISSYTSLVHDMQTGGVNIWESGGSFEVVIIVTSRVRRSVALKARDKYAGSEVKKFFRHWGQ